MLRIAEAVRKGEMTGLVLLVEHDPIYTAGRATPAEDITADMAPVERGGKITYHGPGQLVVYPILRLPERDARAWLRRLEALGVAACAAFGLDATPSVDGTGVFVHGKKVASIGVALRHWINLHGISINFDMDLGPFERIRPCGLDPGVMSDLSRLAGHPIDRSDVVEAVRGCLTLLVDQPAPGIRGTGGTR